jgi:hypothetical protein
MNHSLLKLVVAATSFRSHAPRIRTMWGVLKEFAPYAAIELLLPGGSVLAILCWFYRKRQVASPSAPSKAALTVIASLTRCASS